ncbi:MAG: hypothetical protein ABIZ70_13230 [Gemmatimonadales bacterium]
MPRWLRPIRGAIGMGLVWAFGWAVTGVLIGIASNILTFLPWDAFFLTFDAPLPALAVPGFFCGIFFSTVLSIAARQRRFEELSLPRFTGWGAIGGLLFGALAVLIGLPTGVLLFTGVLSALSACATLAIARKAEQQQRLDQVEGEKLLQYKE